MLSDAELLRRYSAENSEEAFTEFVRRHLNLVYGAALRQVDGAGHVAEEVSQLVFATVAKNAGSLKNHPALGGWLYVAARHTAISFVRAENRRKAREQESLLMQDSSLADSVSQPEGLHFVLGAALEKLGDRDREAVILRFFEGRKYSEIGLINRVSEDAARMRVDRAVEKLRNLLVARGVSSTAAALLAALANEASAQAPSGFSAAVAGKALVAASTTGPTLPILTLMSLNKTYVVALAGIAIFATLTVRQVRTNAHLAHDVTKASETYQAELNNLGELRSDAHRPATVAQSTHSVATSDSSSSAATGLRSPVKSEAASRAVSVKAASSSAIDHAMNNDPKVRADLLAYAEAVNRNLYGSWFASLGFTDKQAEEMIDLMALAKDQTVGSVTLSLRPDDESASDVQQAISQLLKQVLPAKADRAQFWSDISTGEANELTSSLAGNLYDTNYPLSGDQAVQLTQIVANNSAQHNGPAPHWATLSTVNWSAALTQAQAVLSAPQLETLSQEVELVKTGAFIGPQIPGAFGR